MATIDAGRFHKKPYPAEKNMFLSQTPKTESAPPTLPDRTISATVNGKYTADQMPYSVKSRTI